MDWNPADVINRGKKGFQEPVGPGVRVQPHEIPAPQPKFVSFVVYDPGGKFEMSDQQIPKGVFLPNNTFVEALKNAGRGIFEAS